MNEWRPRRPGSTDSSRKLALPQAEVGPERGEEVGGDGSVGCHCPENEKDPRVEVSSEAGCPSSRLSAKRSNGQAPAPLAAPGPPGTRGENHRRSVADLRLGSSRRTERCARLVAAF